jgi:Cytochrome c oxidase subunit IV
MKVETRIFAWGGLFFAPIAIIYGFVTRWHEPVGVAALTLTAGLSGLIGLYLGYVGRHIDARPEDDPNGVIAQGAGPLGTFAPYSWWPMPLALGAALIFAGLAAGFWLCFVGAALGSVALVGWVFEFYRGEHAH